MVKSKVGYGGAHKSHFIGKHATPKRIRKPSFKSGIRKIAHRLLKSFGARRPKTKKARHGLYRIRSFLKKLRRGRKVGYLQSRSGKGLSKLKLNKAGQFHKIITSRGKRYHHRGKFISHKAYKNYKRGINTQGEEIF